MTKLMGIEKGVPTWVVTFLEGEGGGGRGFTASYYNILRRVRTYHPVGFEHTTLLPTGVWGHLLSLPSLQSPFLCALSGRDMERATMDRVLNFCQRDAYWTLCLGGGGLFKRQLSIRASVCAALSFFARFLFYSTGWEMG